MDFGTALKALKDGKAVCRLGWNGKNAWLFFVQVGEWGLMSKHHTSEPLLPWIAMRTADGKIVPWLASQTDIIATDYQIVA